MRRYYYLAGLPGGGWGYVHLSLWDDYMATTTWANGHEAAIREYEDSRRGR